MATSTLKLQTNIPLTGFVRYANYYKGKPWKDPKDGTEKVLPDQIQLKGSWDGSTDEGLYLPLALLGQMIDMGLLRQEQQPDQRGNPAYTVLNGTRKVRVLKTEDGKKKPIHISWADAPATTTAAPPAAASKPQSPAPTAAAPARAASPSKPKPDSVELEKLRKLHRRALATIGETQANAWRGAKYQIDLLLAEWSIERTKIPTHVYLDLIARFGASSGIEAFRQNLVVEHKPKDTPAAAPGAAAQAGSTAGAAALKPVAGDAYEQLHELAPPVPTREELTRDDHPDVDAGPVQDEGYWPEEEDDLPF